MKITKKSLQILRKHGRMLDKNREPRKEYDSRINLIAEILWKSEIIYGSAEEGFAVCNEENQAIYYAKNSWEIRCLAGMSTRYPDCISCCFGNGLNEVEILNPNKLIRCIVS